MTGPVSGWARVQLARHPERPYALDYVRRLLPDFQELHGDRLSGDDPALVAGLATWHGRTVLCMGQQKGRSLTDRIARNFGMMHPEGYRKAMRLARMAARFGFPIITLVDTPGAYPGTRAEEAGMASAIGAAIMEWFRIGTPVVSVVIGEGGSGGALALAVADRVLIQENAVYSVASPETCASIVWRDSTRKEVAAEQLGLTAADLLRVGAVDEVVAEPAGGAHRDHDRAARLLEEAVRRHLGEIVEQPVRTLLEHRSERYRRSGHEALAAPPVRRDSGA